MALRISDTAVGGSTTSSSTTSSPTTSNADALEAKRAAEEAAARRELRLLLERELAELEIEIAKLKEKERKYKAMCPVIYNAQFDLTKAKNSIGNSEDSLSTYYEGNYSGNLTGNMGACCGMISSIQSSLTTVLGEISTQLTKLEYLIAEKERQKREIENQLKGL